MPNFDRKLFRQAKDTVDGAYTPEQIHEANLRHDARERRLPDWFIPVPKRFNKALDDDVLDLIVWEDLTRREEARRLAEASPKLWPTPP